jgi:hypothetical protein
MKALREFFKGSPSDATAEELGKALRAAEAERQRLREQEQSLVVRRRDVLLDWEDEELDAIDAEMAIIQRAAERLDARIPELRRLFEERQGAELEARNKRDQDEAVARRLAIAEEIDDAITVLGKLFEALDGPGATLRRLNDYNRASAVLPSTMALLQPEPDAVRMAILAQAPAFARALRIEEFGGHQREPYHTFEARTLTLLRRGPQSNAPTPTVVAPSPEELASRDQVRGPRYRVAS